jgi:hypothetical protein
MSAFPHQVIRPSSGVFLTLFEGGLVAYDAVEEMVYLLGPLGAIASIEGPTPCTEIVDEMVGGGGIGDVEAMAAVKQTVDDLRSLHLLDRIEPAEPIAPWSGSSRSAADVDGWESGIAHQVADVAITFRSNDPSLLARADACFQPHRAVRCEFGDDDGLRRSAFIDVERLDEGRVRVDARDRWDFDSEAGFFRQILSFVNEYAALACSYATIHAGAVRTPDGRLLLLPGQIDSGKSTLTAALVQAGCDYLSDESVGLLPDSLSLTTYLKPVALSSESREALGLPPESNGMTSVCELSNDVVLLEGAAGPPSEILLPRYAPNGPAHLLERIGPREALRELLANAHNLGRAGGVGLEALAKAAETIPVSRLTYCDARTVAVSLLTTSR